MKSLMLLKKYMVGVIRYECLLQGHIISAIFLQTKEIKTDFDGKVMVYNITLGVPYEKATRQFVFIWISLYIYK